MYNTETRKLLQGLGLNMHDPDQIFLRLLVKFNNEDPELVNPQLRALPAIKATLLDLAREKYNIELDSNGQPLYQIKWHPYFLCWQLELKIKESPANHLAGRPIQINILTKASNNNFNPDDIRKMFRSKYEAALSSRHDDPEFARHIEEIKSDLQTDLDLICLEFYDLPLDKILEKIVNLHNKFICLLGVELAIAKQPTINYIPSKAEILAEIQAIKVHETQLVSNDKRPVIMHAYFQDTTNADRLQVMLSTAEPLSDTSSDLRSNFKDQKPSNHYKIINRVFHLAKDDPYDIQLAEEDTLYRSASITELLNIKNIGSTEGEVRRREVLARITKDIAMQQIIEKLASGQDISQDEYIVKLSFTTLLSPTFSEGIGRAISKGISTAVKPMTYMGFTKARTKADQVSGVLITGNERKQLSEMGQSFNDIEAQSFKFTPEEVENIKLSVLSINPTIDSLDFSMLENLEIKQKNTYINFPVNKAFTIPGIKYPVKMESFDLGKFNSQYNEMGMSKLRANIKEYIAANYSSQIAQTVEAIFTLDITRTILDSNWEDIKLLRELKAKQYDNNIAEIIKHYTRIQEFVHKLGDKGNARIAGGYLIATSSVHVLNHILGFTDYITCKSGKDRTGLYVLLREALLDADSDAKLIENICNALQYSLAKAVNELNIPGCRGLQVDADILSGIKELFGERFEGVERIEQILKANKTRAVGALGKKLYACDSEVNQWVRTHPQPKIQETMPKLKVNKSPSSIPEANSVQQPAEKLILRTPIQVNQSPIVIPPVSSIKLKPIPPKDDDAQSSSDSEDSAPKTVRDLIKRFEQKNPKPKA